MDALESLWGIWKNATRHSSWSFAVVKKTRRFKDNSQISVTASAWTENSLELKLTCLKETNQLAK
jgi:hypothetical protein